MKGKHFTSAAATMLVLGFVVAPAEPALSASPGQPAVPSVLTCAGKKVVKPASYVLACADANEYFKSVHWTNWDMVSAAATGTFVQNNCTPTCVAGKFMSYPAKLWLSEPKATKLGLLFSKVRYSYTVSASTSLPLGPLSAAR
jgi:hypothetical protein